MTIKASFWVALFVTCGLICIGIGLGKRIGLDKLNSSLENRDSEWRQKLIKAELAEFNPKTGIFQLRSKASIAGDIAFEVELSLKK